jgi:hypothetical protein
MVFAHGVRMPCRVYEASPIVAYRTTEQLEGLRQSLTVWALEYRSLGARNYKIGGGTRRRALLNSLGPA